ncbi:Esterase FE4 [Amphibalanus amphitrite]|uniref:Carboxylic ester hydrolase n=1 Tax=Amphibalanus amphitrite TaxID=1232801 RepID=A0A6A4VGL6_AMPAM|nr:Esterase FE4 [Amphibalanus amphitrite]
MGRVTARLAALCAMVVCAVGTASAADPQVTTHSGELSGATLKSFLGKPFSSFRGIPYAEPPLGEMRFRPPQPHRGWSGVRKAKMHGNKCLQFSLFSPGLLEGAEDCLFLNVYTPRLPGDGPDTPLPVMVWIHGGGFVTGSGDFEVHGPDYIMDEEVVLVTLNYRLGPLGFLTTGDAAAPGNYGLLDQVLALEWVQANIAAFGGDPDQVTIFGESAGGASIGLHVLSPRSRGLFARAISQSGAAFSAFAASGEPQGQNARKHAELLQCPTGDSRELVGCVRQKSAKEIFNTMGTLLKEDNVAVLPILYKPRVDRESRLPFLPNDPYSALESGDFNAVPWMMGLNQDEGAFYSFALRNKPDGVQVYTGRDWDRWASSIIQVGGVTAEPAAMAERVHRFYFDGADCGEENLPLLGDLLGDRFFSSSVISEADLAAAHTPVYMYLLDYMGAGRQRVLQVLARVSGKPSSYRDLGVPHAEDLLYLFRQAFGPPVAPDSEEHKMIRFMVSIWTSFARQGHPASEVLPMPKWPLYTKNQREHMRLNDAPSVGRNLFSERVQFWKQLDIRENWRMPLLNSQYRDEL